MASVIYRCPTKDVKVQIWFDEPTNGRETYISIDARPVLGSTS